MKVGTILTTTETKAYWGYCEVSSARFGGQYKTHLPAPLYDQIASGAPFVALSPQDHQDLIAALHQARNPLFVSSLDPHARYEVREWDKLTLAQVAVIPSLGKGQQLPYWAFYFGHPIVTASGPDLFDPRHIAASIPCPSTRSGDAAIAIGPGPYLLMEGYLRSVLFMRDAPHDALFPVLVPV